jgi:O-antigen ligase
MLESTDLEYYSDDLSVQEQYFVSDEYTNIGRNDGWIAAFLLFSIIFGPRTPNTSPLSPLAFIDVVTVVLALTRWLKASQLYGGFLFSRRIRIFSIHMLILTMVLVFSTMVGIALGKYSFVKGAFYMPVVFIRLIFISAIVASLNFGERQIKQFAKGVLFISLMTVTLAFIQRYKPYYLAGFIERFYETYWYQLAIPEKGMGARVVGTFGNTNVFGICMSLLATASLVIGIYMKGLLKLVGIGTFVILAAAVLITTGSRTAFIGLVAVTGLTLLLSMQGQTRLVVLILMILIGSMFVWVLEHIDELPINPRIKTVLGGGRSIHDSLYSRYVIWQEGLNEAKKSILWGQGTSTETGSFVSDNDYVYTLLLTGIIGLGTYLSMLFFLLIRAFKTLHLEHRPLQRAVVLMPGMILIEHMLFEMTGEFFWSVQYGMVLGVFMGVLCGAIAQNIEEQKVYGYQNYQLDEPEGTEEMSFQESI